MLLISEIATNQKVLTEIAIGQKNVVGPLGPNSVLITTIICAALAPTIAGLGAWLKSRRIEVAVNGDRVRLIEESKVTNMKIMELEKSKAVLEERERGRSVADLHIEAVQIKALAKEEGKAEAAKELVPGLRESKP